MTYPTIMPAITLDFANSQQLDPRVTFSRSSSATYINSAGQVAYADEHEPRFDHDPETGESLGLLIEESRTNYTEYSTYEASNYEITNATPTTNQLAPDGTSTAVLLTENTATGFHQIRNKSVQVTTDGTVFTWSVFVKLNGRTKVQFFTGYTQSTVFDVTADTVSPTGSGTITAYADGWYRLTSTSTAIATGNIYQYVRTLDDSGANQYAGDGTSGFYVWGWQSEGNVPFPSSYIPTTGSTITRSADIAQMTGDNFSSWYQPLENTMFAKFSTFDTSTNPKAALVTFDSTQSVASRATVNGGRAFYYIGDTNYIQVTTRTPQKVRRFFANDPGYNPLGQFNSIAQGYAGTDSGCAVNGSDPGYTASAGLNPGTVDSMWIGRDENVSMWLNGHISRITYYNERLTDAELQTLTL